MWFALFSFVYPDTALSIYLISVPEIEEAHVEIAEYEKLLREENLMGSSQESQGKIESKMCIILLNLSNLWSELILNYYLTIKFEQFVKWINSKYLTNFSIDLQPTI